MEQRAPLSRWIFLLRGLTIAGMLFTVYALLSNLVPPGRAIFPANVIPGSAPGTLLVTSVTRDGAALSGLAGGDTIDFDRAGWVARSQLIEAYNGTTIALPVERDGRRMTVLVRTGQRTSGQGLSGLSSLFLIFAGDLWMLAFAYFLSTRKPEDGDVRALCYVLLTYALGSCCLNVVFPNPALNAIKWFFSSPLLALSPTIFALFALRFITPSRRVRAAQLIVWSLLIVTILVALVYVAGIFIGRPTPWDIDGSSWGMFTNSLHYLAPRSAALLCGVWAIVASKGARRARIAWATASVASLYATTIITQAFVVLGLAQHEPGNIFISLGIFLLPAGLTYAVLSRRIIDTGFILNYAVVFSAISLVLLGAFVLVEWMLSDWLTTASRTTNVLFSAGLALTLGVSMRFVHQRIDRIVDTVFFRKRHEDERAIRTFAEEAPYVTDRSTLLDRARSVLERHSDASSVEILIRDDCGRYGDVDENDAGIVRLRASRRPLDIHEVDSALRGDLAFPMVARGRLIGVVILGGRRSGEAFAPDEADAIAQLVRSTGTSLDVLASQREDGAALSERIGTMEAAIIARLKALESTIAGVP
jgi:hypothetical protein